MSRYLKLQVRAQQSFAPRTVVLNVLIAVTYSVTELSREGPCASPDVADTRTVRPSCPVDVGETKQSFKHPAAWDLDGTEWEVEDFCGRDAGGHPGPTHGERPNSQGQHSDVPHVEGQVGLGHGWRAAGGSLGHTQAHIFKRQALLLKDELPVCVCGGGNQGQKGLAASDSGCRGMDTPRLRPWRVQRPQDSTPQGAGRLAMVVSLGGGRRPGLHRAPVSLQPGLKTEPRGRAPGHLFPFPFGSSSL